MAAMPVRAAARFEFRLDQESKRLIAAAAAALGMDASDFARDVLLDKAVEVLAEHDRKTVVPADYFEELQAALDQPAKPNDAMRRALARAHQVVSSPYLHPDGTS